MRIKGILYIFIVSSICSIFFSSCAKEGDLGDLMNPFGNNTTNNPGGKGKAPEDLPAGTTIEWSGYYLVCDNRYGEGTQQLTILNETDCRSSWSVDWGTYTYTKTGDNTAKLSFSIVQSVVGNVRSFQYTTTLTFSKSNEFEMTGTKFVFSTLTGSTLCELHCTGTLY